VVDTAPSERTLGCGCLAQVRWASPDSRTLFVVTAYGSEFICPLGHARGEVVDEDGQPVKVTEVEA
jgi:hypothetical protein